MRWRWIRSSLILSLRGQMTKQAIPSERLLDAAMLVLVAGLFGQGFLPDFKTYRSSDIYEMSSFLWPCVTGVSFLAVYYPFRLAFRVLWVTIAPYAVLVIPMLGFELNQRLNVASGFERWEGNDLSDITLIHFGLVASWATFRLITSSRLSCEDQKSVPSSFGIFHAMRFTAGLSVVFAACRYFPPSSLDYLAQWTLTFFLCYGLSIVAYLSFNFPFASILAVVGFFAAPFKRWSDWSFGRVPDVTEHLVPWILLVIAMLLTRRSGYRVLFLARDRNMH